MRECTEDIFLKDVEKHTLNVLKDDGLYRHLQFRKPGTGCMWFDLITWPGYLVVQGDMGTYVFSRLNDMFEFFRSDRDINPGYWGEKLTASEGDGSHPNFKRFSFYRFKERVEEQIHDWVEEFEGPYDADDEDKETARKQFESELRDEIEGMFDLFEEEDERGAYSALRDFSCDIGGEQFEFSDCWEWNCRDFTYHYLWCCYAIKWGIQQYDKQITDPVMEVMP